MCDLYMSLNHLMSHSCFVFDCRYSIQNYRVKQYSAATQKHASRSGMALPLPLHFLITPQLQLLLLLCFPQAPCTQWQHPNGVHPERLSHGIMQHGLLLLLLHHVQLLLMLHVESSCCMLMLHVVHGCSWQHVRRAHESMGHVHRGSICWTLHNTSWWPEASGMAREWHVAMCSHARGGMRRGLAHSSGWGPSRWRSCWWGNPRCGAGWRRATRQGSWTGRTTRRGVWWRRSPGWRRPTRWGA